MGVPITILGLQYSDGYIHLLDELSNEMRYEILGLSASAGYNAEIVGIPFKGTKDARCLINGKNVYARVLIKKI
jgi:hypothetical protein